MQRLRWVFVQLWSSRKSAGGAVGWVGWGVGRWGVGVGGIILIMSQSSKCNVSQDICIAREKATFWYTLSRIHESEARKFKMNHIDDLLIFIYVF